MGEHEKQMMDDVVEVRNVVVDDDDGGLLRAKEKRGRTRNDYGQRMVLLQGIDRLGLCVWR